MLMNDFEKKINKIKYTQITIMTNLHVNNLDLDFLKLPKMSQKKGNIPNMNVSCFHFGLLNHVFKEKNMFMEVQVFFLQLIRYSQCF